MMHGIAITSLYVTWWQRVKLFDHKGEGTGSI